jgi:putative ABC transport system permease protein
MKYLPLIWAAMSRRKVRTIVTLSSIVVAFLLFGLLDSVRSAFENTGRNDLGTRRLIVHSKVNPFYTPLPLSLSADIQAVPGVTGVTYGSGFWGYYQDPKNQVLIEPDAENWLDFYPEWGLSAAELQVT